MLGEDNNDNTSIMELMKSMPRVRASITGVFPATEQNLQTFLQQLLVYKDKLYRAIEFLLLFGWNTKRYRDVYEFFKRLDPEDSEDDLGELDPIPRVGSHTLGSWISTPSPLVTSWEWHASDV